MVTLAFEIEDGVDDVLERLRPGEVTVLRHVTDEHRGYVLPLRGKQKLRRRFAHLPDAAWRGLKFDREHGLNGVDDHQRRPEARHLLEDPLDAGFRQQVKRRRADTEAVAAALDLVFGLFAGCV